MDIDRHKARGGNEYIYYNTYQSILNSLVGILTADIQRTVYSLYL